MNSKNLLKSVFLSVFLFLISVVFSKAAVAAPKLYLDPSSKTVAKGDEFEIKVNIDVESQNAFGADATLNYPGDDIEIKSVESGGFFSDFSYANDGNKLEIHSFFSTLYDSKSGSGTMAKIKFRAKKDSGSGTITFTCTGSGNDTQILNTDGNNILSCGVLNQSNLTYTSKGSEDTEPPPSEGEPNSCGGTCGSNFNCQANLFCYEGFCRNPACQADTDCVCSTATPTPKPITVTGVGETVSSPTPQAVELKEYTGPDSSWEREEEEEEESFFSQKNLLPIGIAAAVILLSVLGGPALIRFIKKIKSSGKPPTISHGTKPPLPDNPPANP